MSPTLNRLGPIAFLLKLLSGCGATSTKPSTEGPADVAQDHRSFTDDGRPASTDTTREIHVRSDQRRSVRLRILHRQHQQQMTPRVYDTSSPAMLT